MKKFLFFSNKKKKDTAQKEGEKGNESGKGVILRAVSIGGRRNPSFCSMASFSPLLFFSIQTPPLRRKLCSRLQPDYTQSLPSSSPFPSFLLLLFDSQRRRHRRRPTNSKREMCTILFLAQPPSLLFPALSLRCLYVLTHTTFDETVLCCLDPIVLSTILLLFSLDSDSRGSTYSNSRPYTGTWICRCLVATVSFCFQSNHFIPFHSHTGRVLTVQYARSCGVG